MTKFTNCPSCGVNLVGDPIPEAQREFYGAHTHYRREIAITNTSLPRFQCPDCSAEFDETGMLIKEDPTNEDE